jgi:hypothetical protein
MSALVERLRQQLEIDFKYVDLNLFTKAADHITTVEAERDEALKEVERLREDSAETLAMFHARAESNTGAIAALTARLEAAEAALRPFANEADNLHGYRDNQNNGELIFHICVGDFRRARAALTQPATPTE